MFLSVPSTKRISILQSSLEKVTKHYRTVGGSQDIMHSHFGGVWHGVQLYF